jgi:hypothetical protein
MPLAAFTMELDRRQQDIRGAGRKSGCDAGGIALPGPSKLIRVMPA